MIGLVLLVVVLVVLLTLVSNATTFQQSYSWHERQVSGDESCVWYRDEGGTLHREQEGCSERVQGRAEELQRRGFEVVEVEIGRRNSGDLS